MEELKKLVRDWLEIVDNVRETVAHRICICLLACVFVCAQGALGAGSLLFARSKRVCGSFVFAAPFVRDQR